jgi:endonuclease III
VLDVLGVLEHIDKRLKFNQLPVMPTKIDWSVSLRPLLKKYKEKAHPLQYHSTYQLVVMVVLSAQSTDDYINKIAQGFFAAYPDMRSLAKATPEDLWPYLKGVRNFAHKSRWLVSIAEQWKPEMPLTMEVLTEMPGIGRKSANVIRRGTGLPAEGVIVDLHVVRVAPRLGITKETDPKKIEEDLMKKLPQKEWDAGMAMSFLGREICRPKPECEICLMNTVCAYYRKISKSKAAPKSGAGRK